MGDSSAARADIQPHRGTRRCSERPLSPAGGVAADASAVTVIDCCSAVVAEGSGVGEAGTSVGARVAVGGGSVGEGSAVAVATGVSVGGSVGTAVRVGVGDSVFVGVAVQVVIGTPLVSVGASRVAVGQARTVAVLVEVGERGVRGVALAVGEARGVSVTDGRGVKVADLSGTRVGATKGVAVAVAVGSGVGVTEANSRRHIRAAKASE